MTVKEIQRALYLWAWKRGYTNIMPNIYYDPRYEADMFALTKAGYSIEFEIKRSRQDFKADFKNKESKHAGLAFGHLASYFYFVSEGELIDPSDVPRGYGLIFCYKNERSKRIHCKVITSAKKFNHALTKKEPFSLARLRRITNNYSHNNWRKDEDK